MSIETIVNTLSDYDGTEVTATIATAIIYISGVKGETIVDGDSDNTDMAVALLTVNILNNRKNAKSNQLADKVSMEALMTPEINNLLATVDEKLILNFDSDPPSSHWRD